MYVYMYTDAILFMVLAISCANYWGALPGAKIPRSKDAAGSTYVMCGTIGYSRPYWSIPNVFRASQLHEHLHTCCNWTKDIKFKKMLEFFATNQGLQILFLQGDFNRFFYMYIFQHCFICRPLYLQVNCIMTRRLQLIITKCPVNYPYTFAAFHLSRLRMAIL